MTSHLHKNPVEEKQVRGHLHACKLADFGMLNVIMTLGVSALYKIFITAAIVNVQ